MRLTQTISSIYDSALALLYPQSCQVCGEQVSARADGIACRSCWSKVKFICEEDAVCLKCGKLLPGQPANLQSDRVHCQDCRDDPFSAARACGVYDGALRASVLALKREPHLCRRLCEALVLTQQASPLNRATRILPVPLHPRREKARGFNQAVVIGNEVAKLTGLPMSQASLCRTQHSERHRAGMDAVARRASVADAFRVLHPLVVADESILLVDDVFTTGATASACGSALLDAGAREVFVLTLARTGSSSLVGAIHSVS